MDRGLLNQAIELYINTYRARPLILSNIEIDLITNQYFIRGLSMYKIAKVNKLNYGSVKSALYWIRSKYEELASKYSTDELENRSIEKSYEDIVIYINKNMSKSGIRIISGIQQNFGFSEETATKAFHKFMDEWCYPKIPKVDIKDNYID